MPGYPHTIRLRGPWEWNSAGNSAGRIKVPMDWVPERLVEDDTSLVLTRSFQSPPPLDEDERLWLLVTGADPAAEVLLNGQLLGTVNGYGLLGEFEITPHLQPRNRLQLTLPATTGVLRPGREQLPRGLVGEIWLEVRRTSFLSDFVIYPRMVENGFVLQATVHLGAGDAMAELHVGGRSWSQDPVVVRDGQRVELEFDVAEAAGPAEIEVELVMGADRLWTNVTKTSWRSPLPAESLTADQLRPAAEIAKVESAGQHFVLEAVLPPAAYEQAERSGARVLQSLPAAWLQETGRRLAGHAAIAGWIVTTSDTTPSDTTTSETKNSETSTKLPAQLFGRPVFIWNEQRGLDPLR